MMTAMLGGDVKSAEHGGEYGRMAMNISPGSRAFSYLDAASVNVWMSHGDEAVKLPEGFKAVAKSTQVRARRGAGGGRAASGKAEAMDFRPRCVCVRTLRVRQLAALHLGALCFCRACA